MPKRAVTPQNAPKGETGDKENKPELVALPVTLADTAKRLLIEYQKAQMSYKVQLDLLVSSYLLGRGMTLGDNDTITVSDDHTTVIIFRK